MSCNADVEPWVHETDILSLKSFPGTSILRYGRKGEHLCVCRDFERHRSMFDVNLLFTSQNLLGLADSPKLRVCHNAENIWECALPRALTGLDRRVVFERLPDVKTALRVLRKGTYWYRQLLSSKKFKNSAFQRKMARLLAGLSSPEGSENFHAVKAMKVNGGAVQRLRSLLATVDGLLMQVTLAFPGSADFQSWKRIDQIQRSLISQILDDYFKDLSPDRTLTFDKVKNLRKEIKRVGFNPSLEMSEVVVPRELSAVRVALSLIRGNTPLSHLQVMVMSQTRASGVPPRSVYDRTLAKTKEILTTPSDKDAYRIISGPLARATDHVYHDLLTRLKGEEQRYAFFQKVTEAAKVSLSDSGEFFTKADLGGKLEASRRVLTTHPEIPEVSLDTGQYTGRILTDADSQGERLFHWACGKFVDRSKIYDNNNMSCRISLVAELGKYRTITVSSLQHALLLHPMSHMGLTILEAMPSSESGIGAANHAWNFFKRLSHKNPSASFIFNEKIQTSVASTDWSQATDYTDPYIAGAMFNRFTNLLGMPAWYRQTCLLALTAPRQVETLGRNGEPIEVFYTSRGVLMGDPVTKVILHLHHLIGRKIAGLLLQDVFVDDVLNQDESSDEDE
uniref:RNA-dependent RNA polymerase n=1 Tax=Downy mildew lesion associated splipalmivirus 6 TaxID=2719531 RepID=A0A6G9RTQ6_9VIRU|nr:RNA-dependent RNA polymerase [Plasmopara viticola lesion associated narnavirus 6]